MRKIFIIVMMILLSSFVYADICSQEKSDYTFYMDTYAPFGDNFSIASGNPRYSDEWIPMNSTNNASLRTVSESLGVFQDNIKDSNSIIFWMNVSYNPNNVRRIILLRSNSDGGGWDSGVEIGSVGVKDQGVIWHNFETEAYSTYPVTINKPVQIMVQHNGTDGWNIYARDYVNESWTDVVKGRVGVTTGIKHFDYFAIRNEGASSPLEVVYHGDIRTFNWSESGECLSGIPINEITLLNETAMNSSQPVNIAYNISIPVDNCSLYTNATGSYQLYDTSIGLNETTTHNFTYDDTNGLISYFINCSINSIVSLSDIRYFYIDLFPPTITTTYPKEDGTTEFIESIPFYINSTFTDNLDLYSYNVTIDGVYANFSLISGTSYDFYADIDMTNLSNTTYTLNIEVCDSHTQDKIKEAKTIITEGATLRFEWDDDIIQITSLDDYITDYDVEYKTDRYTFKAKYHTKINKKSFKIVSGDHVKYLEYSKYKGHFIFYNKYWVDFETDGDVKVKIDNDGNYLITVENDKKDLEFNSVGFLNCVSESYDFEKTDLPPPEPDTIYNIDLIPENTFNTSVADLTTTTGVLVFGLLFFIWILLIVMSEYLKLGIGMILGSIYGIFLGIVIYSALTSIGGIIFIFINAIYMFSVGRFL